MSYQEPTDKIPWHKFDNRKLCPECSFEIDDGLLACKHCYGQPDQQLVDKQVARRASVRGQKKRREYVEKQGQDNFLDSVPAVDLGASVKKCHRCEEVIPTNLLDCPFCVLGTKKEEEYSD